MQFNWFDIGFFNPQVPGEVDVYVPRELERSSGIITSIVHFNAVLIAIEGDVRCGESR